jgi:hypothetical protein
VQCNAGSKNNNGTSIEEQYGTGMRGTERHHLLQIVADSAPRRIQDDAPVHGERGRSLYFPVNFARGRPDRRLPARR